MPSMLVTKPKTFYNSYTISLTMPVETEVKTWGNSLGIIIPAEEVKKLKLKKGDRVRVEIIAKKRIDGFGMWKGEKYEPFVRDPDREIIR